MLAFLCLVGAADVSRATDISVIALTKDRAVLVVNGGAPRTLKAGESAEGVTLVSADAHAAVVEVDGKRRSLSLGQGVYSVGPVAPSKSSVTISADPRGHFITDGRINGAAVKFLVDTGATLISMNSAEAKRLGINYLKGERGLASTANGVVPAYKVELDEVRVGAITLRNVGALVQEGAGPPLVLLGMSFLSRVEMVRNGDSMTLQKRF